MSDEVVARTEVLPGHGAGKVVHAVRQSAFGDRDPIDAPAVDDVLEESFGLGDIRNLVRVVDGENVGAVEAGASIGTSGIERIVAVEEESLGKSAAFIQRVGPCVRRVYHESAAHPLLNAELKSLI